ncbi:MAG TPA: dCMP deaminase family protein [Firmicutes bacterium]|nr:dCMP deaminase family protein [Bacillota bacterium]
MRKSWDRYFMDMAKVAASRSTCLRRQVGAVAVSPDNRILGTGYNGALPGTPHCEETGCLRQQMNIPSGERQEICRAQHAEANICNIAARYGIPLEGATIYVTNQPCVTCMKAIITSGIKRIVYEGDYPDAFAVRIAEEAGIELVKMEQAEK